MVIVINHETLAQIPEAKLNLFSPFTTGVVMRQEGSEVGTLLVRDTSNSGTTYCRLDGENVVNR